MGNFRIKSLDTEGSNGAVGLDTGGISATAGFNIQEDTEGMEGEGSSSDGVGEGEVWGIRGADGDTDSINAGSNVNGMGTESIDSGAGLNNKATEESGIGELKSHWRQVGH